MQSNIVTSVAYRVGSLSAIFIAVSLGGVCVMFNRNSAMGLRLQCIERNDDYSIRHDIFDLRRKQLPFSTQIYS